MLLAALTGCTNDTFTRIGFPNPITKQGLVTLHLWQGSWIAGMAVAVAVWALILWAVVFHRKRRGDDRLPPQVRYNLPIEILYTAVPFVLIAVLFYYTARDEDYIDTLTSNPNLTVNVVGYQWSWQFSYPQYKLTNGTGVVTDNGVMYPGPLPVLEVPTNETVRFNLTSPDVIHSFWVPEFLFKRDVIPGHPNHFEVTLTRTGTYTGHCSELCGLYHSRMLFTIKVVTPQQFQQWITQQQSLPSSGQPAQLPTNAGGTFYGGSASGTDANTATRSGGK